MKKLRRLFGATLVAFTLAVLSPSPAYAVAFADPPVSAATFEIPVVPLAVVSILAFLSPLAIAVVNQPFWPAASKRVVAIVASLLLSAIALVIYYSATGEPLPQWWFLLLLGVAVSQASYLVITKGAADRIEAATSGE